MQILHRKKSKFSVLFVTKSSESVKLFKFALSFSRMNSQFDFRKGSLVERGKVVSSRMPGFFS